MFIRFALGFTCLERDRVVSPFLLVFLCHDGSVSMVIRCANNSLQLSNNVDTTYNEITLRASTDLLCVAAVGVGQGCKFEITKPRFVLWTATHIQNAAF